MTAFLQSRIGGSVQRDRAAEHDERSARGVEFAIPSGGSLNASQVDQWWESHIRPATGAGQLLCARPSRPSCVFVARSGQRSAPIDFEVFCPNPDCELNRAAWSRCIAHLVLTNRRITVLKDILDKLRPEPSRDTPLPLPRRYEPPSKTVEIATAVPRIAHPDPSPRGIPPPPARTRPAYPPRPSHVTVLYYRKPIGAAPVAAAGGSANRTARSSSGFDGYGGASLSIA